MPPSSTTSNWDFTPVINLLRSPSRQRENHLPSDPFGSSPTSHEITKHDVRSNIKEQPSKDLDVSSPKLGDFGSLWGLLEDNTSFSSAAHSPQPEDKEPFEHARPSVQPVIVLKRPANPDIPAAKPSSLPRPRNPEPIPRFADSYGHQSKGTRPLTKPFVVLKRPTISDTPVEGSELPHVIPSKSSKSRPLVAEQPSPLTAQNVLEPISRKKGNTQTDNKSKTTGQRCRNGNSPEVILSDSAAEAESDNSLSVFDTPMIPPQVGISEVKAGLLETPPSSFEEPNGFLTPHGFKHPSGGDASRLKPLSYRSASDQQVGLLTKLLKDFPDYAELLVQAGRSKTTKNLDISSRPVHVFVDMSNIMVGFHDTMKASRNIPLKTRIRRLPLSYQNFSLILERGRPAAKRVLVGSDRIAATSESELLGYEANILNRVQKVKSLTTRQLKFRKNPRQTAQDGGHGSETNDGSEERWVEQGVDEILHLKILESLLDTDEPATIVLATGDAAEAEYSGGFMKMVERALRRGWKVELVSFKQTTSYAYQKKEFKSRWKDQFRIIGLDDYVEELLKV
ncbi:hypothetical protein BJY04DRAFT_203794 [Aspergillus karnatakaensis]|uniref:uncharacterized protein n=1 Tax=Aspergillus karnatakaensis TaxID=1810916 RepID=UPI003CCDF3A0